MHFGLLTLVSVILAINHSYGNDCSQCVDATYQFITNVTDLFVYQLVRLQIDGSVTAVNN